MEPYNLEHQFTNFSKISSHIALFLPRTSNLNQLAQYAQGENQVQVMHYCMKGASKVCHGASFDDNKESELIHGRRYVCIMETLRTSMSLKRMRKCCWMLLRDELRISLGESSSKSIGLKSRSGHDVEPTGLQAAMSGLFHAD